MTPDPIEDLVPWLRSRLDEDEQAALEMGNPAPWPPSVVERARRGGPGTSFLPLTSSEAAHIERHGPARVLREIDADRKLLNDYMAAKETVDAAAHPDMYDVGRAQGLEEAVRYRALPYAARPGYREEWRP